MVTVWEMLSSLVVPFFSDAYEVWDEHELNEAVDQVCFLVDCDIPEIASAAKEMYEVIFESVHVEQAEIHYALEDAEYGG